MPRQASLILAALVVVCLAIAGVNAQTSGEKLVDLVNNYRASKGVPKYSDRLPVPTFFFICL